MQDNLGRTIDYMRISITDRCNLRCRYCMPQPVARLPQGDILRHEETLRVARAAVALGIRNFKITGGEPLVRQGCAGLIASLKTIKGVGRVSMTTNGVLLKENLSALLCAGLDAVTISLDTLRPACYEVLAGAPGPGRALAALEAALQSGLTVKLNCVPLAGVNEEDILPLAALAAEYKLDVRFIETMPIGPARGFTAIPPGEVFATVDGTFGPLAKSEEKRGCGPAEYYTSDRLRGSVGFISALSHEFCQRCNRVRLSSTGRLKLCLYHDSGVDLRALLRAGASDKALRDALRDAVAQKPARHDFKAGQAVPGTGKMYQIGG